MHGSTHSWDAQALKNRTIGAASYLETIKETRAEPRDFRFQGATFHGR